MQTELDSVEAELEVVELQIAELLEKQASLTSRRKRLLRKLEEACDSAQPSVSSSDSGSGPAMTKQELLRYENDGTVEVTMYRMWHMRTIYTECTKH